MIDPGQLPVVDDVTRKAKVHQNVRIEVSEDILVAAVDALEEVREGNGVHFNASEDKFVDVILSVSVDSPSEEFGDKNNVKKGAVHDSEFDDSVNSSIEAVFGTQSIYIFLTPFMSSSFGVLKLFWFIETNSKVAWDSCISEDMISWPPDFPKLGLLQ